MYDRYNYTDPSTRNYGKFKRSGLNTPITIDSNPQYTVILSRHCNGVCSYDIGGVSDAGHRVHEKIDQCSDRTGAPNQCARAYLGKQVDFAGNRGYDRLG
jgi:hypothetical protein